MGEECITLRRLSTQRNNEERSVVQDVAECASIADEVARSECVKAAKTQFKGLRPSKALANDKRDAARIRELGLSRFFATAILASHKKMVALYTALRKCISDTPTKRKCKPVRRELKIVSRRIRNIRRAQQHHRMETMLVRSAKCLNLKCSQRIARAVRKLSRSLRLGGKSRRGGRRKSRRGRNSRRRSRGDRHRSQRGSKSRKSGSLRRARVHRKLSKLYLKAARCLTRSCSRKVKYAIRKQLKTLGRKNRAGRRNRTGRKRSNARVLVNVNFSVGSQGSNSATSRSSKRSRRRFSIIRRARIHVKVH